MKSKDLQMYATTLESTRMGKARGGELSRQRPGDGLSIFVGIERSSCVGQLCSILDRIGVAYDSLENVEQLQHVSSSVQHGLAIISLGFWESGAKYLYESQLGLPRGVQFALWVGDQPVDIDYVVEGIRLGAVAVIHGESCETRLSLLIKELQASAAEMPSASEPSHDRPNAPIASVGDDSTHSNGWPAARRVSTSRRKALGSESNGSNRVDLLARRAGQPAASAVNGKKPEGESPREQLEQFILGRSAAIQSIRERILNVASTRATVMIFGESGTGKELVARAVHHFSDRSQQPFVPVNMSAIPEGLAESLLFGHEKGAFTSAHEKHQGWCQTAHGGTLFLDEIGDMELAVQPKLLRFLQEGTLQTIGAKSSSRVDVRLITATNRDPKTIVQEGRLRDDLFFRLHVVPMFVPPLRERREDIAVLAEFFLRQSAERHRRNVTGFSEEAIQVLSRFNWPGNVRQLENAIERIVIFAEGPTAQAMEIPAEFHAPARLWNGHVNGHEETVCNGSGPARNPTTDEAEEVLGRLTLFQLNERTAIIDALQRTSGHVVDAAKLLGLGQATMYRKIKQYAVPNERKRRKVSPK